VLGSPVLGGPVLGSPVLGSPVLGSEAAELLLAAGVDQALVDDLLEKSN
jgi:hypothetical protein